MTVQTLDVVKSRMQKTMVALPTLYPLLVERHLVHRIWGGQRIGDWLSLHEPRQVQIGESWQVFDTNAVLNGLLSNFSLGDITRHYGADLVGTRTIERYGSDFPLLTKFLDASSKLSVQVHPDDDYAHTYEALSGFHGKSEAWYILRAAPGATVVSGLKPGCTREDFIAAIEADQVEQMLHYMPVQAGDTVYIPAGTVHNINAGVLLFEIQQKSDLTYRIYDYKRVDSATGQPRTLHIDKALDVIDFTSLPRSRSVATPLDAAGKRQLLTSCPYFALENWMIGEEFSWRTDPGSLEIITVIENQGLLTWEDGMLPLHLGDSVVLPASLGNVSIRPLPVKSPQTLNGMESTDLRVVRTYVPGS